MRFLQTSSNHQTESNRVAAGFRARWLRNVAGSVALGALLLTALWLALPNTEPRVNAQTSNAATIIVQLDKQARVVRHVEFTTPISGLTALQESGLNVVYSDTSFGPAVCSIQGVGCPVTDCFCNANYYWGYNYWDGQKWQSYPIGAADSIISKTGSIEGWQWGAFGDTAVGVSSTLAADSALRWLQARQVITDGGYGSVGASVEVLLALSANQEAATEWRQDAGNPSLASYITLNGARYTQAAAGAAGKTAVALSAADLCLPVGALTPQDYYSPTLKAYSEQNGSNSWAMLGAVAVNELVPVTAVAGLRASALPEGAWEWSPGWGADTNSTALAIQALIATGEPISASSVVSGLAYLASAQNTDGGFPYALGPNSDSDGNSTAYVVQALVAAQQDPSGASWTISNSNPISYLLSLQLTDGSFEWQPGSGANQLATMQIIPALLGQAYPIAQRELTTCPVTRMPAISGN